MRRKVKGGKSLRMSEGLIANSNGEILGNLAGVEGQEDRLYHHEQ